MSALDELIEKEENTDVELCIMFYGDEQTASEEDLETAFHAAAEYAALRASAEALADIEKIANDINLSNAAGMLKIQRRLKSLRGSA
jgi:hypothetical protein